jgi:GMP synthase-like glutamine amidotransferase/tetratricopeptide (TPR) repeat protein/DNA-binding CsgD family transcriptional regulator
VRALAFEHLRPNPIGVYGDVLDGRGIGVDGIRVAEGESIPDWRAYDFLVVMGAGANVWDHERHPWIVPEKQTVREAVLAGVPYFGVCFGAQLLASAFGAHSYRGMEPELGINQMFLTAAARRDPVFRGFPPDLEVCEWHSNHFALPMGAVRLARSPRYENQAIRFGRVAYAIQCHLETSREDLEVWLELFPDTVGLFESRHGPGSVPVFLDDYGAFVPRLRETARQVFGRWLENALAVGNLAGTARAVRTVAPRDDEPTRGLIGRDGERARIGTALTTARHGGSAVIVIRGEAGAGKTVLLNDAVARAAGLRVLRTRGADPEGDQRFAALSELCRPLLGELARVPDARAAAVAAALGVDSPARVVDRYTVYAGTLDLLTAAADENPLLVAVDDAHLLDDASAEGIAFIAQRLRIDGIALMIATESDDGFSHAEEVRLGPLDPAHARALLSARFQGELAPAVVERIVESGQRNPLALLEIARGLEPPQRTGDAPLERSLAPSAEWVYLRRVEALPPDARRALLLAALAEGGDRATIVRACATFGLDSAVLDTAERAGIIEQDATRVLFCHELARTAVSYSALAAERRLAHDALAKAAPESERRLWHQARASTGVDDVVADGLECVATRARAQGAYAAAAHALELAARLTSNGDLRAKRLLAAAQADHLAGHLHAALDHLGAALESASAPSLWIELVHLRGRIAARSGAARRARDWLTAAADRCEHDDPTKAAEILADAVLPSLRAGSPDDAARVARRAMRLAEGTGDRVQRHATLQLGVALLFAGDYLEALALIERADAMTPHDGTNAGEDLAPPYMGPALALAGRYQRAREALGRLIVEARNAGAVDMLPYALVRLAGVELDTGRWRAAAAALEEAVELAQETGNSADRGLALGTLAWLEAAQGNADACRAHVEEAIELAERLGPGSALDRAAAALGLLELGSGRPEAAIAPLEEVRRLQQRGWSDAALMPHRMPDLVEAYALAGRTEEAQSALDDFRRDAERAQRPSALALAARCGALLAPDCELDARFTDALQMHVEAGGPFEHARTNLLYGSRLADGGRAGMATERLSTALRGFEELGADPWARRAREVLVAAIGAAPPVQISPLQRLTPLELEVALAAGDGATHEQVAHQLFLGPRTARLLRASAMAKLGVESTAELAAALGPERSPIARVL